MHIEKLRNRADGLAVVPFEAGLEPLGKGAIRWSNRDLKPPLLVQATELFQAGMTVREVGAMLGISKSEAGRLRVRTMERPAECG